MPTQFDPQPVTLVGRYVRLELLQPDHAAQLFEASQDASIWTNLPAKMPTCTHDMEQFIQEANERAGDSFQSNIPFAIIDKQSNRAIGSTRYLNIRRPHRSFEIGYTWITPRWQRTGVNTECKLLLLSHAFEGLGALRVEFKTDARNVRSQNALLRLGALYEGTFRQHMIMPDGFVRDSMYYSIIETDWAAVKDRLESKLESHMD